MRETRFLAQKSHAHDKRLETGFLMNAGNLMELTPLLYESHSHTPLCKHARGEPEAYAAVAEERGLKGIIFTCHSPMPNGWSASLRMAPEEFDTYVACVERARKTWAGRVDVRLGMESDYFP